MSQAPMLLDLGALEKPVLEGSAYQDAMDHARYVSPTRDEWVRRTHVLKIRLIINDLDLRVAGSA
jgi:hypothetical protein